MDFARIEIEAATLLAAPGGARERLQSLCELMKLRLPYYDWFGFYVARRIEPLLDLGPYSGESTEHVLIPFGRGICGQAAESRRTFVVDDVSAQPNYLACSLKVKSEIVVPVFASAGSDPGERRFTGEIDIDSHTAGAFKREDLLFLERLAVLVSADLEALRK
jgi:GAF domain-containing protein